MDRQEAVRVIETWCRDNSSLSARDCRRIAEQLADRALEKCRDPSWMSDRRRQTVQLVPRHDAAAMLRRCLEHQDMSSPRRMSEFDLRRTAGQIWLWITEDVVGIEPVFREPTGGGGGIRA
jgi:hypothetical protein